MAEKADVIVYTSGWCGYCSGVKIPLTKKGISFTEIRMDDELDPLLGLKDSSD